MRLRLPVWTPLLLVALLVAAWPVAGLASGGPKPEWVHSDEGDPVPNGDPVNAAADDVAAELAQAGVTSVGLETAPWRGSERATDNPASTSSGSKIKLVYAYAADQPDRFGQYASIIQTDAKAIAETVAATSGGTKTLRFDTGTDGGAGYVDIASVRLPQAAAVYQGMTAASRSAAIKAAVGATVRVNGVAHYAVYADGLYGGDWVSGIAEMYVDERKSASNNNNRDGLWAMVWGDGSPTFSSSHRTTLLHEITHTLGGVQRNAPHGTTNGHCSDRLDVMCYDDGGMKAGQTLTQSCGSVQFDCNADDYFNAAPAAGSYLAANWNVYDSSFLCSPSTCVSGGPTNIAPEAPIDESGYTSTQPDDRHRHGHHRLERHRHRHRAEEAHPRGPRRRRAARRRPPRAGPRRPRQAAPALLRAGHRPPARLALRRLASRGLGEQAPPCGPLADRPARRPPCPPQLRQGRERLLRGDVLAGERPRRLRAGRGLLKPVAPPVESRALMGYGTLRYNVAETGVARIELDRPETRNALSDAVLDDLLGALGDARDDAAVRCVVIASTHPTTFSAGGDLTEFAAPAPLVLKHQGLDRFPRLFRLLGELGKPSICAAGGHVLAGALGLALACDLVVASEEATFGTPEIHVGLFPFMVSALAYRNLPRKKVNELMLLGERIDAAEALRLGLVNKVVPAAELDAAVDDWAGRLASKSPVLLRLGKDAMYRQMDLGFAEALDLLQHSLSLAFATEDIQEGVRAFFEKREATWTGR